MNLVKFLIYMERWSPKVKWKDYAFYINKNLISFDIYRRSSEKTLLQIIKILKGKKDFKYKVKDQHVKL